MGNWPFWHFVTVPFATFIFLVTCIWPFWHCVTATFCTFDFLGFCAIGPSDILSLPPSALLIFWFCAIGLSVYLSIILRAILFLNIFCFDKNYVLSLVWSRSLWFVLAQCITLLSIFYISIYYMPHILVSLSFLTTPYHLNYFYSNMNMIKANTLHMCRFPQICENIWFLNLIDKTTYSDYTKFIKNIQYENGHQKTTWPPKN